MLLKWTLCVACEPANRIIHGFMLALLMADYISLKLFNTAAKTLVYGVPFTRNWNFLLFRGPCTFDSSMLCTITSNEVWICVSDIEVKIFSPYHVYMSEEQIYSSNKYRQINISLMDSEFPEKHPYDKTIPQPISSNTHTHSFIFLQSFYFPVHMINAQRLPRIPPPHPWNFNRNIVTFSFNRDER